jgi:hypothetical protein
MDYPILPISVREAPGSRSSGRGRNPEDGFEYIIVGTDKEWLARLFLDAATPLTLGAEPMWKQSVEVKERPGTYEIWDGVVKYGPVKLPDVGDWTWGFDSAVETHHVTHGKAHIADYAPPAKTAKNHKGAIGVSQDGTVEGADWYYPKFEWWEKHLLQYTGAAAAWALSTKLAEFGGCLNNATFRGFGPGTVLFLGGSGGRSETRPGLFELTVKFRAEVDKTGLTIGDITGIAKKAWEYLWIESEAAVDAVAAGMVQKPRHVHIERMGDWVDFSQLGINVGPPTY